ncbi:MAG: acyloxyacyl hydrolase [Alphaproteobacteria bacterium]|nr:acyloxyacyl hydrolase [Alphaproteobacteria bacterium]
MYRRFLAALGGLILAATLTARDAAADPAVQGIAAGAIATVAAGVLLNPMDPDADREFIFAGGGVFDVVDDEDQAALYNFEYWAPFTFFRFRPFGGILGTSDSAVGGYVGVRHDLQIGKRLIVSASTAATGFSAGDGKWLGASVVLRSGVEVAFRFDNGIRLSGGFHHMSHGKVFSDTNPGTETATFALAVPTDVLFGGQLFKGKHYWPKLLGW